MATFFQIAEVQKGTPTDTPTSRLTELERTISQLKEEVRKDPSKQRELAERIKTTRDEMLSLRRELNRSKQFSSIQNKLVEGRNRLDEISAADLMKIDKESKLRRGEFLSKSFLYKRIIDNDGMILEEPSNGKDIKEGDILFVDFGKNRSAEVKIGAGDTLARDISVIEVTDANGKKRIGKRSIRGKKVGYYDENGYIPIFNGSTIRILGQKDLEEFDKRTNGIVTLSTNDEEENKAKDAFIKVAESYEKAGPSYAPGLVPGQREYTQKAKELSEMVEEKYGIPKEVVFAQAAIESGWGTSGKSRSQNNFFGITNGGREKGFRTFGSMEESFNEYGRLLSGNQRYRGAFAYKNNPVLFIETILKAGYIDTSVDNHDNYMRMAREIIGKYDRYSTTYLDYNTRGSGTNELFRELGGTREAIEGQLVSINFLGKNVNIHKSIATALNNAAMDISKDPVASKYKIYSAGGYNWRQKRGGSTLSNHALGIAIDVNPTDNMGDFGDGSCNIPPAFVNIMKKHGFIWGGDWKKPKDPMHFEFSNLQNLKVAKTNAGLATT